MSRRLLLRLLFAAPPTDHVSDAELLRRFVASNDSAAFELIVRRHANAVWAACRRVLNSDADAEDAFQATFLALLRKARDIRTPSTGGWLHRVAVNAALKLRERNARTSTTEPNQLDAIPAPNAEPPDNELAAAVHEELAQLSERERLPVVLCDLEGLSHADAATALGWPVGTVSGRLSRARAKLRERLERRGLTPSGAVLPVVAAPPHLIPNAVSLTTSAAPPAIVSLAEGVLAMTTSTTWKWVAAAVVCVGALGAGGVLAFGPGNQPGPRDAPALRLAAENPAPPEKGKPVEGDWIPKPGADGTSAVPSAFPELTLSEFPPTDEGRKSREEQLAKRCPRLTGKTAVTVAPTDDALRKVLKARLHQGTLELQETLTVIRMGGKWDWPQQAAMYELLTDIRATATELWSAQPKELIPWLEELVVLTKEFERVHRVRVTLGTDTPRSVALAARHRLAVEAAPDQGKGQTVTFTKSQPAP